MAFGHVVEIVRRCVCLVCAILCACVWWLWLYATRCRECALFCDSKCPSTCLCALAHTYAAPTGPPPASGTRAQVLSINKVTLELPVEPFAAGTTAVDGVGVNRSTDSSDTLPPPRPRPDSRQGGLASPCPSLRGVEKPEHGTSPGLFATIPIHYMCCCCA